MKFLSDNLLMLALAVVLGISPLQTITASVSKCAEMDQSAHHQMMVSDKSAQHDMSPSDISNPDISNQANQEDCCKQNTCDMSHCSGTFAAVIISDTQNNMTYTVSNVYLKPSVSLIQFYPLSLYRPPRFNSSLSA